jgi:hypothetical protein
MRPVPGASIRGRQTPYGAAPENPLDQWQARSKNRVGGAQGSRSRTASTAGSRTSTLAGSVAICRPEVRPTCGHCTAFPKGIAGLRALSRHSQRPMTLARDGLPMKRSSPWRSLRLKPHTGVCREVAHATSGRGAVFSGSPSAKASQ